MNEEMRSKSQVLLYLAYADRRCWMSKSSYKNYLIFPEVKKQKTRREISDLTRATCEVEKPEGTRV